MSEPNLYLATPCYGGLAHALYMRSLMALRAACGAEGVALQLDVGGGEALIGRGRASMMAKFLAGPASHLLFVDADVGFEPEAVFRLLRSGRDVVGGIYPRKAPATGFEVGPALGEPDAEGFQSVAYVGAGFLLVSRDAAAKICAAHPQLQAGLGDVRGAQVARAVMVFDSFIDADTGLYLADHQAFCRRWRDLGGQVWADLRSTLSHVGEATASGPPPADTSLQAADA